MAITKAQIIQQLTDAGIQFDESATVGDLKALLPKEVAAADDAADAANAAPAAPTVDGERQARWAAFLESARAQREDPTIFDQQKARGEFDAIPPTFL